MKSQQMHLQEHTHMSYTFLLVPRETQILQSTEGNDVYVYLLQKDW